MDMNFPLVLATSSLQILLTVIVVIAFLKFANCYGLHIQASVQNKIDVFNNWWNARQAENFQPNLQTIMEEEISEASSEDEPDELNTGFVLKHVSKFQRKQCFQTSTPIQHTLENLISLTASTSIYHNDSDKNNITNKDITKCLNWYENHENESNNEILQDFLKHVDESILNITNEIDQMSPKCLHEWMEWLKNEKNTMHLDRNKSKSSELLDCLLQQEEVINEIVWKEWDETSRENSDYVHEIEKSLVNEWIFCSREDDEDATSKDLDTEDEKEKLFSNYPDEGSSSIESSEDDDDNRLPCEDT